MTIAAAIQIRPASAADAPALADLLGELGYPAAAGEVPARLATFERAGNGRVLVAVVGGVVRAFAAVEITRPIHQARPVGHLTAFAVSHTARRQGVGRRLIQAVEQLAIDAGCGQVTVTSAEHRADAHAFYPSAGWAPTGRRFGKQLEQPTPEAATIPRRVIVAYPRIVDQAAWRAILAVRDRYDPLAGKLQAHLTLVFPFEDAMSDRDLEQLVRRTVAAVPAFEITLGGITAHENEYLFLNVKRGNDALIQLHDLLYEGPLARHLVRSHTFVPHVTVGRLPPHALALALQATATVDQPITARIDGVSSHRIAANDARVDLFQVPLNADFLQTS